MKQKNKIFIIIATLVGAIIIGGFYYISVDKHKFTTNQTEQPALLFLVNGQPIQGVPAKSANWSLLITLKSTTSIIQLSKEDWMADPVIYYEQLSNARERISSNFSQDIIANDEQRAKLIKQINSDINSLQKELEYMSHIQVLFQSLLDDHEQAIWGTLGKRATSEQLQTLQPLWVSLISLSGDCVYNLNKQILVKNQGIKALQF